MNKGQLLKVINALELDKNVADLMIKVDDGILECCVFDIQKTTLARVRLPSDHGNVELPISNIEKVRTLLKRFSDTTTVQRSKNRLTANDGVRRGWVELGDNEIIDSYQSYIERDEPFVKQTAMLHDYHTINIDVAVMREKHKDAKAVDSTYTTFKIVNGTLKVITKGEGIGIESDIGTTEGSLNVTFGEPLRKVIECTFETNIDMYLKTDMPIYIKGEHSEYIIAPCDIEK